MQNRRAIKPISAALRLWRYEAKENFGCEVPPNITSTDLEMEGMSNVNKNGQCTNLLDCGSVCSVFPRMAIGQILAGKDFSKLRGLVLYLGDTSVVAQVARKF